MNQARAAMQPRGLDHVDGATHVDIQVMSVVVVGRSEYCGKMINLLATFCGIDDVAS